MFQGPTSRLDTIELKGFDDDVSGEGGLLSTSDNAPDKISGTERKNTSGKRISFFDELSHYEDIHPIRKHQMNRYGPSNRENDTDTSNNGSPPPARSTPTKELAELTLETKEQEKNVNVSNFEDFMKFDSILNVSFGLMWA